MISDNALFAAASFLVTGCGQGDCCRRATTIKKRFARNDPVFANELEFTGATFVVEGLVGRVRELRDGARQIVSLHFPGDYIHLGAEAGQSMAGAVALTASVVGGIDLSDTFSRASRHPAIMLEWMNRDAAIKQEWCASIGRKRALARIACLLCEFIIRTRQTGVEAANLTMPLSQADLGDCTGLTPVHVNRMLAELRKAGLVEITQQRMDVIDFAGLAAVADFDDRYLGEPRIIFDR